MPGFCVPYQQPDLTVQGLRASVQRLEDAVTGLQQQAVVVQQQMEAAEAQLKELSDRLYSQEHYLTEAVEQLQPLGDVNPGRVRVGKSRKKPLPALTVPETGQYQRETEASRLHAEHSV